MEPQTLMRSVWKTFGIGATPVLKDFSLKLNTGTCTAIMGPNACGKTTLIRILLGIEPVDEGDMMRAPSHEDRAGAVLQDFHQQLIAWASVETNVSIVRRSSAEKAGGRGALAAVMSHLQSWGFAISPSQRVGSLSGGQRQALVLARSMLFAADLWLLDEPMSAIDVNRKSILCDAIAQRIRSRLGAIFITHDPVDAIRLADRVLVVENEMRVVGEVHVPRPNDMAPSRLFREGVLREPLRKLEVILAGTP